MTVKSIDHINLRAQAPLMEDLRRFYTEVVGLREGPRPDVGPQQHGHWLYAGERAIVHLVVAQPGDGRDGTTTSTYDHVALACTGLADTQRHLTERGVPFQSFPLPDVRQHVLFCKDPAGNGVELNFREEDA